MTAVYTRSSTLPEDVQKLFPLRPVGRCDDQLRRQAVVPRVVRLASRNAFVQRKVPVSSENSSDIYTSFLDEVPNRMRGQQVSCITG